MVQSLEDWIWPPGVSKGDVMSSLFMERIRVSLFSSPTSIPGVWGMLPRCRFSMGILVVVLMVEGEDQ